MIDDEPVQKTILQWQGQYCPAGVLRTARVAVWAVNEFRDAGVALFLSSSNTMLQPCLCFQPPASLACNLRKSVGALVAAQQAPPPCASVASGRPAGPLYTFQYKIADILQAARSREARHRTGERRPASGVAANLDAENSPNATCSRTAAPGVELSTRCLLPPCWEPCCDAKSQTCALLRTWQ